LKYTVHMNLVYDLLLVRLIWCIIIYLSKKGDPMFTFYKQIIKKKKFLKNIQVIK